MRRRRRRLCIGTFTPDCIDCEPLPSMSKGQQQLFPFISEREKNLMCGNFTHHLRAHCSLCTTDLLSHAHKHTPAGTPRNPFVALITRTPSKGDWPSRVSCIRMTTTMENDNNGDGNGIERNGHCTAPYFFPRSNGSLLVTGATSIRGNQTHQADELSFSLGRNTINHHHGHGLLPMTNGTKPEHNTH